MAETKKIAISLPEPLVKLVEKERKRTGESRSAFIRRALHRLLEEKEYLLRVNEYNEGYRSHPETEEEIAAAEAAAAGLFESEPWERATACRRPASPTWTASPPSRKNAWWN